MRAKEFILEGEELEEFWTKIPSLFSKRAPKQKPGRNPIPKGKFLPTPAALGKFFSTHAYEIARWSVYAFAIVDAYKVIEKRLDLKTNPLENPIDWIEEFVANSSRLEELTPGDYAEIGLDVLIWLFAMRKLVPAPEMTSGMAKSELAKAGQGFVKRLIERIKKIYSSAKTAKGWTKGAAAVGSFLTSAAAITAGELTGYAAWDKVFGDGDTPPPPGTDWEAFREDLRQALKNEAGFSGTDDMPEEPGLEPTTFTPFGIL